MTLADVTSALRQAYQDCGRKMDAADVPTQAYETEQGIVIAIVEGEWACPGLFLNVRLRAADLLNVAWIGVQVAEAIQPHWKRLPDA